MDKLPIKIRRDLRDRWETADSPAQKSIAQLKDVLGLQVRVDFEVQMLWAELQKFFPDTETFIPTVAGVIQDWMECVRQRLEDDANADWTETFLEYVGSGRGGLKLTVQTSPTTRVTTTLARTGSEFLLVLPASKPPYNSSALNIRRDLDSIFKKKDDKSAEGDDWAKVEMPSRERTQGAASGGAVPTRLPSLDMLPRPEDLFESRAPYYIIVEVLHERIVVQASHQPSLELLTEYLRKYRSTMVNDARKTVELELLQSNFGMGLFFDALNIDAKSNRVQLNPVLILSFVESVLGYALLRTTSGGNEWTFRRETAFAS